MIIALPQAVLTTLLAIAIPNSGLSNVPPKSIVQSTTSQDSTLLIATAYTDQTLPTLGRGSRGQDVEQLQQILLDNGFLGAASARLGTGAWGVAIDGIFGEVTESAVRDLQQQYDDQVTGVVTPATWERLDISENPYRSPLPWKF
jgi:peptidoglycan hydrolase-like protein with peptidoglycan-binding domain